MFLIKHQLTDQSGYSLIIYTVPPDDLKLGSINIPDFIFRTLHSARNISAGQIIRQHAPDNLITLTFTSYRVTIFKHLGE